MTTIHGACCGPSDATNVHRDCPGSWAGWGGEVLVCECSCHGGIALNQRGNGVSGVLTWDNGGHNKAAPGGASTPLLQGPRRSTKEID